MYILKYQRKDSKDKLELKFWFKKELDDFVNKNDIENYSVSSDNARNIEDVAPYNVTICIRIPVFARNEKDAMEIGFNPAYIREELESKVMADFGMSAAKITRVKNWVDQESIPWNQKQPYVSVKQFLKRDFVDFKPILPREKSKK